MIFSSILRNFADFVPVLKKFEKFAVLSNFTKFALIARNFEKNAPVSRNF